MYVCMYICKDRQTERTFICDEMRGLRPLWGRCPKRDKKARNTIINNNERHNIYHNIYKLETTKETGKRNRLMGPGRWTGVQEQKKTTQTTCKHTKHRNEGVTIKVRRANAKLARMSVDTPRTSAQLYLSSTHTSKQTNTQHQQTDTSTQMKPEGTKKNKVRRGP
jgi:hypothetical protein